MAKNQSQSKEVVMKTRVLCIVAAGLLASGCLFAQSSATTLKVTVPFGFQAGSAIYPAGDYTVTRMELQPLVLVLKSIDRKHNGFVLAHPRYAPAKNVTPKLVFNRYAGTHFLRQVWGIGAGGSQLTPTREEKEFASRLGRQAEEIMVAASR
jgi:hypothetical protein